MELLFKNIERHVSLSAGDKKLLEEIYHVKKVKRKQFLLEAGEVSKYTYFVTKGCIRTYYTDKEGEEHVIGFSIEDWWAGDLAGFSTGESSIFSIDALEDSEVLCADRNGLERMYREIPQMEK